MLRETLEGTRRSPFAGKYMGIVLAMPAIGPNTQDKAERFMAATGHHLEDLMDGHLSYPWYCWRGGQQDRPTPAGPLDSSGRKYGVVPRHRVLSSGEFMSVGDTDTLGHPQLFGATTYESRCCLPE